MAIKRVGIVGSGIMGSGISEVAAKAGIEVVLRSRAQSTADAMVAGLEKSLAKQVERRTVGEIDEAGDAHRGDVLVGFGIATVQHGQPRRLRSQAPEPCRRLLDRPVGVLERGRGRHDQHLVALREVQ